MSRKRRRPGTPSGSGSGSGPAHGSGSTASGSGARGRGKGTVPSPLRGNADTSRGSGRPRSAATAKGTAPRSAATGKGAARGGSRGAASARAARTTGRSSSGSRSGSTARASSPARPGVPVVVQPPLLPSLARGLIIAGTSPVLVVSGSVATFVLWLIYSATGLFRLASPAVTAQLISLLPVHSLLDIQFLVLIGRLLTGVAAFAFGALLLALRAGLTSFWTGIALDAARTPSTAGGGAEPVDPSPPGRGWREALQVGMGSVRGSIRTVLGVEAVSLTLVALTTVLLTWVLGPLGTILAPVAVMYFLAYAPVVAVSEGLPLKHVLRLSVRAARARGPQHMLLVLSYVSIPLLLIVRAGGPGTPATPSILVWAYALSFSFVHLGVLAAVATRWLALRERVLAAAAAAPPRGGRTSRPERPRTSLRGR